MWGFSYWALPIISSIVWLAMLLAMFISWFKDGRPHYASMQEGQNIAYISDVGAERLKPLFIAMSAVTVVTFDLAFLAELWLRRTGRLASTTSKGQVVLSACASVAAVAGAAGLILLSIFDTLRHKRLHDGFLVLFIGGYIISAVFVCAEYQRLGVRYRQFRILRASFWIKLFFILVEVALAIAFGVSQRTGKYNVAAILEWVIALIFTFYVASFFLDFIPAVHNKSGQSHETTLDLAIAESQDGRAKRPNGRFYGDGYNGTTGVNGHANNNNNNNNNNNTTTMDDQVPTRYQRSGWI